MNPEELKKVALLRSIDDETLARLATVLEAKDYVDGASVFDEGAPGDSMYFIVDGRVRIEKRSHAADSVRKTLTVLDAGDYFGEMALLDQKPRSASALATGSVRVLRLSKNSFDDLQQTSRHAATELLFAMIRTSGDRIRRLSSQVVVYDEVGKAIGEARDLDELLNVILQQLLSATAADWGFIVLRSQFSDQLEIRCHSNLTLTPEQKEMMGRGQGFLEPALHNPEGQLLHQFGEAEPFKSCSRLGFETPALILSPITREKHALGLIVLGGKERAQFDLDALNLARGVSQQAAQAILHARHREEERARSRHSRQFVRF